MRQLSVYRLLAIDKPGKIVSGYVSQSSGLLYYERLLPQSHPSFAALHPTTVAILEDIVDRLDRTSTLKVMASGYNIVPDVLHSTIARISYHGQDNLQNVPGVQVNRVDVVRRLSRRTTSVSTKVAGNSTPALYTVSRMRASPPSPPLPTISSPVLSAVSRMRA